VLLAHGYESLILKPQLELTTVLAIELQATGREAGTEQVSELEKCNVLTGRYQQACVAHAMTKARLM
jgi:hypothetical protein